MKKTGFKDALPIMAGYFPIAMAYGILAKSVGITMTDGIMFSIFLYAGAAQFMVASMIGAGISALSIILAVFFMNFRHFIMSASVRARLTKTNRKYYSIIGFFLTDESYSVVSLKKEIDDPGYLISLELSAYAAWVGGTAAGYLFGMFIPAIITDSMGIALYALFVALLIPAGKQAKSALLVALIAGGLNSLFIRFTNLEQSGSFILTVLSVAAMGTLFKRNFPLKKEGKSYES
ncbi:AzlC family ABC transporter permease [Gottschalkiaceae bacterium SANA]|nr:AzlC family ABC transporter permease [Gottschalkiaceae bacterium SANA]